MDVYHQIAGQVFFTNQAISEGLYEVPPARQLIVDYESFCENPEVVYQEISKKYAELGSTLNKKYTGKPSFNCTNEIKLSDGDIDQLTSAYDEFTEGLIGG